MTGTASNNNRKLFATDLDGTILNDEKRITPKTMEALKSFNALGHVFAICTGRDLNSARSVYDGLGVNLKKSFVIAYNGGVIYDVDEASIVYRIGIDPKMAWEIFGLAADYGIHVHTYNDDFILSTAYNECIEYYRKVIKTPLIVADDISKYMTVPPAKIICIELHDHEKQQSFKKMIEERYGDYLSLMYSNDYYLELIPKESGKGNALLRLAEYLDIAKDSTIAAGDAENDASMIAAAGLGIAMINGDAEVKKVADVITEYDNNHDGLAPFIR